MVTFVVPRPGADAVRVITPPSEVEPDPVGSNGRTIAIDLRLFP